ncbi:MAG: glycosyltransferase family 4 protein [Pirellulales bacterium]
MRILVVSNLYPPDFIGGYELCCAQVVDALLARGHDVHVLTSAPRVPCPARPHVARVFKLANCYDPYAQANSRLVTRRLWEAEANFVNAHNVYLLSSAIETFRPDVVYLWNLVGLGGLGLIGCLQQLSFPWVWYLGDCVPRLLCSRGEGVPAALAEAFNRRVQGVYMPVSRRVVEEIEEAGLRLNGHIEIAPNWIEGRRPLPRADYFAPGRPLRIVSAGQMGSHKGIDLLIEAAALLRKRGFEAFSIDLFGRLDSPVLPRLAEAEGVGDLVTFKGLCPQAELVARYRRHEYDLFAFPTWRREPFGCAPLEAAAYECVMLMSENCGIGEWFVGGVHCLKVPRTSNALADAFQQVLEGRIDLAPIGRRAAAVIWRDFHLDKLAERIEEVLAEAARQPRVAAAPAGNVYRLALLAEKLTQAIVQEDDRSLKAA